MRSKSTGDRISLSLIFGRHIRQLVWAPFIALPCRRLWRNCHFRHICQIRHIRQLLWAPSLLCAFPCRRLWRNCHFRHICQIRRFRQLLWAPFTALCFPRWRLWQNCHFRHICQIRRFRQLLWGPFTALCFASLAIVAKLSFSPYLPNSPLSATFMGPPHCFVFFLVGDCGKNVIFAIFAKFAAFANFYGAPSLLCALPRWRLLQNCHFRHICQIRRFRQLLWAPSTALCFSSLAIVAKLSFSPHLRNSPLSPTFMGPLHCFVFCLVGYCGKIVIFAIFAKFTSFGNLYGPPSLLCVFPRWRLWQNCHFRHICQIRRFRQLLWGHFTALCFASLAIVAKLSFSPYLPNSPLSPTFMGPLHCFVFFLVGDCGKIVLFATFAKLATFANFYGPPSLLCVLPRWLLWQNCHFRHICQIYLFRQPLWAPFTALCFSSLAIVAKLSFSPYLPNSPLSPTFMGPLHCFVLCLVGDCCKIVIFAIFAKFAAFANFYGPPPLLCVFPRWRLWQNCPFRHICEIRHFRQLLWAPFTALCFASLAIVAKLSFSPYLPNSPLSATFMGPLHCFVFFLVNDCGKIVIFAIFAKFAAFANFYGAPSLLCALPRWRLLQNCHFRHICQIRRFRNFYGRPPLLCVFSRWRLWQNCPFRHICEIRHFRQLLWAPFTALCFASLAIVAKLSFSPYLPNSALSATFMGPLHCFVFCLVGDFGKIVIFAIFAKFAGFGNFYGPPSLLCVFPRWRLWQNCHFRHICQIRRFRQLLWAPFTALCFSSLAIVAKLSFSPHLRNSPLSPTFMGPLHCFVFSSLAIVAKLSFSPYLPNSPLSPTLMGPLHCFVLCLLGDCGNIVIFAIFAEFANIFSFLPFLLLCAFLDISLLQRNIYSWNLYLATIYGQP